MSPDTKPPKILPPYPYSHRHGHEGRKAPGHSLFELLVPTLWHTHHQLEIKRTAEEYLSEYEETGLVDMHKLDWLREVTLNDFDPRSNLESLSEAGMVAWRIWQSSRDVMTLEQATNVDWVLLENVQPRSLTHFREGMMQLAYHYRCITPPDGWKPRRRSIKARVDALRERV